MQKRQTWWAGVAVLALLALPMAAEAQEATPAETPAGAGEGASPEAAAASDGAAVDDVGLQIGRAEMVLIENDDPESALEFGMEIGDAGPHQPRLLFLLATCLLRLERFDEAAEHFERMAQATAEADPQLHLHGLYALGRVFMAADDPARAADAFDRYLAFARSHSDLVSHVGPVESLVVTLRARAQPRQSSP